MTLDDFLNHIEAGGALNTPEIYRLMDEMSDEARRDVYKRQVVGGVPARHIRDIDRNEK